MSASALHDIPFHEERLARLRTRFQLALQKRFCVDSRCGRISPQPTLEPDQIFDFTNSHRLIVARVYCHTWKRLQVATTVSTDPTAQSTWKWLYGGKYFDRVEFAKALFADLAETDAEPIELPFLRDGAVYLYYPDITPSCRMATEIAKAKAVGAIQ